MSLLSEQLALALDTIEAKSQKFVCVACAARMMNIASDSDLDTSEHQLIQWDLIPYGAAGEDPLPHTGRYVVPRLTVRGRHKTGV